MMTIYNVDVDKDILEHNLIKILNQTYRLLPIREEGQDWKGWVPEEPRDPQVYGPRQEGHDQQMGRLEGEGGFGHGTSAR